MTCLNPTLVVYGESSCLWLQRRGCPFLLSDETFLAFDFLSPPSPTTESMCLGIVQIEEIIVQVQTREAPVILRAVPGYRLVTLVYRPYGRGGKL